MPLYQFYVVKGGEVEGGVDAEFADEGSPVSAARTDRLDPLRMLAETNG